MKKIVLLASFVGASFFANAQTSQGNIAIGGTLGITSSGGKVTTGSTSVDQPKSTSINIIPEVSYFISDKFAIGLGVGYGRTSNPAKDNTTDPSGKSYDLKNSVSGVTVNPFAKYYMSVGEKASFLLRGGVDMNFGTSKSQFVKRTSVSGSPTTYAVADNDPGKTSVIDFGIKPGFLFFPSDKFGVEVIFGNLLGYKSTTTTDKVSNPTGSGTVDKKTTDNTLSFLGIGTTNLSVSVFYFIK
jgi:hypothetical protein